MNRFLDLLARYFCRREEWVIFAVIIWLPLFEMASLSLSGWKDFASILLQLSVIALPLLLFKFIQYQAIGKRYKWYLYGTWASVFLGYPTTLFFIYQKMQWHDFPVTLFVLCTLVEILLLVNRKVVNVSSKFVFPNISLDKMIILTIGFFALMLSLWATSDLTLWKQSNAVNPRLNMTEILQNLPVFFSMAIQFWLFFMLGYLLYFVNDRLLIRRVLKQGGTVVYVLALLSCLAILFPVITELALMLPINYMGEPLIPAHTANPFDLDNARVALAVMITSLPVILNMQWNRDREQLKSAEKQRVDTELELLKQQIDPHFLFNTLNNLYALTLKKSDDAPEVVMQLSDLMRYVVYQGQKDSVKVAEEIEYLRDYIELQSIRFEKSLQLHVELDATAISYRIPPLLLVILVENAFKHGIEKLDGHAQLSVKLSCKESELVFQCTNDKPERGPISEQGLGLKNLKRRLDLLYPNCKDLLEVHDSGTCYSATMRVPYV